MELIDEFRDACSTIIAAYKNGEAELDNAKTEIELQAEALRSGFLDSMPDDVLDACFEEMQTLYVTAVSKKDIPDQDAHLELEACAESLFPHAALVRSHVKNADTQIMIATLDLL